MSEIDNYVEVMQALSQFENMQPDGSYEKVIVDNPNMNGGPPEYLQLSIPRKANTFKLIEQMKLFGLSIKDVWQYDCDKKKDRIMMNIVNSKDL